MIDTIHFFASREDLCNIFNAVEQEFDIKYCIESADKEVAKDEMPKMEFDTIEEIADDCNAAHLIEPHYLIAPKTEVMKTEWHVLKNRDDIVRYHMNYNANWNSVVLKGMEKHEDLTNEYYVHVNRKHETEFSGAIFKRIVREVKRNCVRVKAVTPIYIGKEMYKNKDELVFSGMRCGAFTVTEANEAKTWYRSPKVREFADKPFLEQLAFLQDVFYGKELKNFKEERKSRSDDNQMYRVASSQIWRIKDLCLLKEVFALFDDDVKVDAAWSAQTAMEDLCDAAIYVASAHKPDGIRILLDSLKYIPEKGYHCGCEGIIRILLKKKYFEKFKIGLASAAEDTKKLVKKILEGITDKRTLDQRKEMIRLLDTEQI